MKAVELVCPAALGELPFLGRVHQAHDLIQHKHRVVFFDPMSFGTLVLADIMSVSFVSVAAISGACAMQLPSFTYQCSWHEFRLSLSLESVQFHRSP
jgi:hypothetical protein